MNCFKTLAIVVLSCSPALAEDWPQWRGPNRDGAAPSSPALRTTLPAEGLKPAWTSETLPGGFAGGWGSPIVAAGRVYLFVHHKNQKQDAKLPERKYPYLADDKRGHLTPAQYEEYEKNRRAEDLEIGKLYQFTESLYAFDLATGKTVWKSDRPSVYTRFVQSGTLTHADGKLYFLGAGRHVHCVDAATGNNVWSKLLPGEFVDEFFMSSIAVVDGTAVFFAGNLFGLDAATGELLWQGDDKAKGQHSSAVVWRAGDRNYVIANVSGGQTACFEPRTGKEVWRVKSEANNSTPVVVGDKLLTYGGTRSAGLRCFQMTPTGAEELWAYRRAADKGSSPVVSGGHVFVQGEKRLACVELESGDEAWNTTLDLASPQYTSLVAADGKVLYAYDGLLAFADDATEYRELVNVKFDKSGLMATEDHLRKLLKLDEIEKQPNGLEESTKVYQREITNQGPLPCTSPAIVDGRLLLRLRNALVCYDLRDQRATAGL